MKRRSITLLVCLLMCLALGSVGFAAWVITSDGTNTKEGMIKVDTVEDARVNIEASFVDEPQFIFGSKTPNANNKYKWIKHVDSGLNEDLSITVKLVIGNYTALQDSGTALSLTLTADNNLYHNNLVAAGLTGELPVINLTKADMVGKQNGVKSFTPSYSNIDDHVCYQHMIDPSHDHSVGPCQYQNCQHEDAVLDEYGICTRCTLASVTIEVELTVEWGTKFDFDNHNHTYVEGVCDCGHLENHTHSYTDGTCACGIKEATANHKHNYSYGEENGLMVGQCSCGEHKALNPIDYYNNLAYTKELGDSALAELEKLEETISLIDETLKYCKFTLTIEPFTGYEE